MRYKWVLLVGILFGVIGLGLALTRPVKALYGNLSSIEQLGKLIFFDKNLSLNHNQACAACHGPDFGYTGPDTAINAAGGVYEGSISGAFGNRKPPASAYAGESPVLHFEDEVGWVGGMFWDGRATGMTLDDPLAEQAKGPFLNPKEQAIPDAAVLCSMVAASNYSDLFEKVWGAGSVDCSTPTNVSVVYDEIARSIAAYERSLEVSAFTSKFDAFWLRADEKGLDITAIDDKNWKKYSHLGLETEELKGLALFNTQAKCSGCHSLEPGSEGFPLFTDFTYDNLGVPKNPLNPATLADPNYADPGLGGYLKNANYPSEVYLAEMGKFKVPTLRNVALAPDQKTIKAYTHNAFFKSLKEIVHFYNTRDVASWPAPETLANLNKTEVGNLGLSDRQEDQIVAFLKTLSDGWKK